MEGTSLLDTRELLKDQTRRPYQPGRMHRFSQWAMDHWVFEVLASLMSAACFTAIVVIFTLRAKRPLLDWPLTSRSTPWYPRYQPSPDQRFWYQ